MRLLLQHRTEYSYGKPASLGPHTVRLRPATHAKAKIETYALQVKQPCEVRWQQDPAGNRVARLTFGGDRVGSLDLLVEMAVDVRPVNPFDFFIDPSAEMSPFPYADEILRDLSPYLDLTDPAYETGERFAEFQRDLPRDGKTVDLVVALNRACNRRLKYVIREEPGVWTPEETLREARGSCRDSASLLVALLRSRGLAARFVSGYLIQLTDEGMIPDEPRGVERDVVDLHAWAEVFLPGGGWIGLDATSGLLCGEGHIPLACAARASAAAPLDGTTDVAADRMRFEMKVGRLGHEPRPTAPFSEATWAELLASGDLTDAALAKHGVELTSGGEPTFTSRLYPNAAEWNTAALGPTKWEQGLVLAHELRTRLAPGAALLRRSGKHYPGESLPRWALDIIGRRDGTPLVRTRPAPVPAKGEARPSLTDARRMMNAIAERLGISSDLAQPGFEDPWHYVHEEALLPVGVDPHRANLKDPEDRRRLAKVLDRGLASDVGYVLPLKPSTEVAGGAGWVGERWTFRRERLYLIPGDSPMGLRLPLESIAGLPPPPPDEEPYYGQPDPRRADPSKAAKQSSIKGRKAETETKPADREVDPPIRSGIKTAMCVEPREGSVYVFLPPLQSAARFCDLVRAIDEASAALDIPVILEGYPPPKSFELLTFSVTPDPGVLEVNIPPTRTSREHVTLMESVFDAAAHSGLVSEKYQVDGRQSGSGGGNHITLGGPSPLSSPFVRRPDLLASLVTFVQHHPSLSYLFTGLFVGPTSQAPRVDEARHDSLYEIEVALAKLREANPLGYAPPWLGDALLRNLLVDVSGNTHRTELCIDKLFDPGSPHGRQGLVELRAFEMPPHVRMAVAQTALVRALIAGFAREAYEPNGGKLVRWGQVLHDRFLLPTWLWRDFEDVLAYVDSAGVPLPKDAYRSLLELRCPIVGALQAADVRMELRNAIEPWNVLGEETSATGTSRYVDSSMERIEVRVEGLIPERHVVTVNGHALPLRPTGTAGEHVGGVRFRAWAPPHSLHPHIGIHHPLRFDVLDTWGKRSTGACSYHVWHPEGRGYEEPPLTRFEASARRAQRFTSASPMLYPAVAYAAPAHADAPYTLDLRRFDIDRPMPEP